jgi:hypothetical protein
MQHNMCLLKQQVVAVQRHMLQEQQLVAVSPQVMVGLQERLPAAGHQHTTPGHAVTSTSSTSAADVANSTQNTLTVTAAPVPVHVHADPLMQCPELLPEHFIFSMSTCNLRAWLQQLKLAVAPAAAKALLQAWPAPQSVKEWLPPLGVPRMVMLCSANHFLPVRMTA